jgi:hypothetical protein
LAVSALDEVTFGTNGNGARLPAPVAMLIAANWDLSGAGRVFSRDDATGGWTAATLAQDRPTPNFLPQVRSFGRHRADGDRPLILSCIPRSPAFIRDARIDTQHQIGKPSGKYPLIRFREDKS